MSQPKITDYFLVIEQNPRDSGSDLLAVRREGGRMFGGEKPEGAAEHAQWFGVKYTCVDRIARSGNDAGRVYMTTRYAGWIKLAVKELRTNKLAEWTKDLPAPIDLSTIGA